MKLRKTGNTLVVTVPSHLADAMRWEEGDELEIEVQGRNALKVSRKDDVICEACLEEVGADDKTHGKLAFNGVLHAWVTPYLTACGLEFAEARAKA